MNVFITGDAYMSASYPMLIAAEMLRASAVKGHKIVAVDFEGAVPMIVRSLAEHVGLELELVKPTEGQALDDFHRAVLEAYNPVEVVMIHDEPMVSTVYQSLSRVVTDDKLRLASTLDFFV